MKIVMKGLYGGFGRAMLMLCMAGLFAPSQSFAVEASQVYTLGVVPQFGQRQIFSIWTPIVDELKKRTGLEIRLLATLTVEDFEAAIEQGRFDFVYANPFHILQVKDTQGYIPMVRDSEPLRGILLVRKDSGIKKLQELAGKTLAVPSPNALGASLLLRADLERLYGVKMQMVNVKSHSSVYLNVLNGLADAGGGVEKTLHEQEQGVQDGLRILYTTREMPAHPVAAHPRVMASVRELVRKSLLEMNATEDGHRLLKNIPMSSPVSATLKDYLPMQHWGLKRYWIDNDQ